MSDIFATIEIYMENEKTDIFLQKKFFEKFFFLNKETCYGAKKIAGKGSMLEAPPPNFF